MRGKAMDVRDYCKNVDKELSQWRNKLDHIVHELDSMPTGIKQPLYETVNGLHILMTEMEDRIEQLRTECQISWEPETESPNPNIAGTSKRFKDTKDVHFDYDFGG